jgi:hypothetical protein
MTEPQMSRREWTIAAVALVIGALTMRGCTSFLSWLEIDGCLDSGGKWDYQFKQCIGSRHDDEASPPGS